MQSNMAATLNIDWILDLARDAARAQGHEVARKELLAALDARVLDAKPGVVLYHPYILEAGERGPFVDANARAQFIGLSHAARLMPTWCARSSRAWRSPRAIATRRWGRCPARSA